MPQDYPPTADRALSRSQESAVAPAAPYRLFRASRAKAASMRAERRPH